MWQIINKHSLMFSIQKNHYSDYAGRTIGHFWANQGVQLQAFELILEKAKSPWFE